MELSFTADQAGLSDMISSEKNSLKSDDNSKQRPEA